MSLTYNQKRLAQLGELLFPGAYGGKVAWRYRVAEALGLPSSTVKSWMRDGREVPDERIEQLKAIGRERARKIMEVCE